MHTVTAGNCNNVIALLCWIDYKQHAQAKLIHALPQRSYINSVAGHFKRIKGLNLRLSTHTAQRSHRRSTYGQERQTQHFGERLRFFSSQQLIYRDYFFLFLMIGAIPLSDGFENQKTILFDLSFVLNCKALLYSHQFIRGLKHHAVSLNLYKHKNSEQKGANQRKEDREANCRC